MKTEKLKDLFASSMICEPDDLQNYIISLMSKFEVGLVWDEHNLLIPSLLPSENGQTHPGEVKVRAERSGCLV